MDKEADVLEWAQRQVNLIAQKFSSEENLPIFFNDYDSMDLLKVYPIPGATDDKRGGSLKIIYNGSKSKTIDYKFFTGTVLKIHHHPDYKECFKILYGSMIDEVTGIEKHKGDYFEILPYTPHQWRCTKDARMMIDCKKVF